MEEKAQDSNKEKEEGMFFLEVEGELFPFPLTASEVLNYLESSRTKESKKKQTQNRIEDLKTATKEHRKKMLTDENYKKKVEKTKKLIKEKLLNFGADYEKN